MTLLHGGLRRTHPKEPGYLLAIFLGVISNMFNSNKINHELDYDVVVIGAGCGRFGCWLFSQRAGKSRCPRTGGATRLITVRRSAALYIEGYENPVVAGLTAQSGGFFRTQHEGARPLLHDRGGLAIAVEGQERALKVPFDVAALLPNLKPLTPAECRLICPILDNKKLIGGAYDPDWKSIDTHELIKLSSRPAQ